MPRKRKSFLPPSGEYLKKIRQDRGLLQSEIAEIVGVDTRTWRRWENGEALISEPAFNFLSAKFMGDIK